MGYIKRLIGLEYDKKKKKKTDAETATLNRNLLTLLKSSLLRLVSEELVQLLLVVFRELANVDLAGVHFVDCLFVYIRGTNQRNMR